MKKKSKILGQVYTPPWIVSTILDYVDYKWKKILNQKILEPSFWDGIFLLEIVKRIIKESKKNKLKLDEIKKILENNIYGIELDKKEYNKAIDNLNNFIKNNLDKEIKIKWNLVNWDTLIEYKHFIWKMDYVVWNPPFIRIHNLEKETIKLIKNNFEFTDWNLDIYTSFFELWLELLNKNWQLGYITPNSYLHNTSYKRFRNYLKEKKLLKILLDFKWIKVFDWYSTYTSISILDFNKKRKNFTYKEYIDKKIIDINTIEYDSLDDKDWSFSTKENMDFLKRIKNSKEKIKNNFEVQYWLWTLRDKIFITEEIRTKDTIQFYKISKIKSPEDFKNQHHQIINPYKISNNKFIIKKETELEKETLNYLLKNKEELNKRDKGKTDKYEAWYAYGRKQGLNIYQKDTYIIPIPGMIKQGQSFFSISIKELNIPFLFSSGFLLEIEEKEKEKVLSFLNSEEFQIILKQEGKVWKGKTEETSYYSLSITQLKRILN